MATVPDMFPPQSTVDEGMWLKAAQAAIRAYCGWHVCPSVMRTIKVDSYGGQTLILPTKHVTDVSSVKILGVERINDVSWSDAGIIRLNSGRFPDDLRAVEVTMTDGYDPSDVPQLMSMMLTVARRAQIQPGIASQSVNGSSISYATGNAPGVSLFDSEKALLDPYRIGGAM